MKLTAAHSQFSETLLCVRRCISLHLACFFPLLHMLAAVFAMQLYDFESEDGPATVAFHPSEQIFTCGFNSGTIRVFDIASAKLLAEHEYVASHAAPVGLLERGFIPVNTCQVVLLHVKHLSLLITFLSTGCTLETWLASPSPQTGSSCTAQIHRVLWLFTTPQRKATVSSDLCVSARARICRIRSSYLHVSPVSFDIFVSVCDGSGNMVARGSERAPDALALSSDSRRLAFVGPTEYVVTIADSRTLDEVSRS